MTSLQLPMPFNRTCSPSISAWRLLRWLFAALAAALATLASTATLAAAGDQTLTLPTGQGRIIRFDHQASSIFIANPEVADVQVVSPGVAYLFGKQRGETNLIALGEDSSTQSSIAIQVRDASDAATQSLQRLGGDSEVQLVTVGDRLVARGVSADVGKALVTQSTLASHVPAGGAVDDQSTLAGTNQINIRVRFAEVSRDELRRYGVSWSALINNGSFSFGILTSSTVPVASGGDSVDGLLQALENNGLVQILAEPNITTVTGQTASFLAGGEIPIPVPVNSDLVGIQYKQYGVSLLSTPTLLPDGRISMQVRPEVSSLLDNSNVEIGGYSIPALQVRRADTMVEVGSGQTFAIAGLFQRSASTDMERIPVLGQIPILGNLFRSRRFQRNETELVILITPYLVSPTSTPARTPLDQARVDDQQRLRATSMEPNDDFGFTMQ
ncbi:type II and III secretion system protein family protein [Halotalea alkalilenta]|uniref:Type II and III secretion system protein RhcC2 n=1 Tax=Halotalea alkalilenta TaxID=376489 RepID=A0A172YHK5_9GAMM|nr:type II and III secretion system protein family protein [Halotalea alkalilenta]ANF58738.1 type II and III secretion system protein RhcC2 [Halotalea alkalilenta]